jgi:single-strand DNA-binding protein
MKDTEITVVGNVATEPESQMTAKGVPFTRFRLATSARRWDAERGGWTDGMTSFYTVRTWRAMAGNVKESVGLGEPMVVHGRLRIREEERDGRRHAVAEIEASAVGHDLSRGTTRFTRPTSPPPTGTPPPPAPVPAAEIPAQPAQAQSAPVPREPADRPPHAAAPAPAATAAAP